NASTPGASVAKGDTTKLTKQSKKHMTSASHKKKHTASPSHKQKKHMASYKQRNHDKAMKSKAQTTGSGSTSAPGASINKDDTTPKSRYSHRQPERKEPRWSRLFSFEIRDCRNKRWRILECGSKANQEKEPQPSV